MAIILQGVFKGAAAGIFLFVGSTTQPPKIVLAPSVSTTAPHNGDAAGFTDRKVIVLPAPAVPDPDVRMRDVLQDFHKDFKKRVASGHQTEFNACFTRTSGEIDPVRVNHIRAALVKDGARDYTQAPIVILDRGHGSDNDMGAAYNGLLEASVVDAVSEKLKPALEERGTYVIQTRGAVADGQKLGREYKFKDQDRTLQWRAELAYRVSQFFPDRPVIFLSLHANTSSIARRAGAEVYHYSGTGQASSESRDLARHMAAHYRTSRATSILSDNFAVLRCQSKETPAILLELGYLTNESDFAFLRSAVKNGKKAGKIATMIADGIQSYIDSRKAGEPVVTIAMNGP